MQKETKEQVVETILENAEHCPWKVASAVYGKLPPVLMRNKKVTYEQAIEMTRDLVQDLGTLSDNDDMNNIRQMLLKRIDLSE
jgi:hypothetical protein